MNNISIDTVKGSNPLYALKCFFQGLSLLRSKELRPFLVIPLAINVVLYLTAFGLGYFYVTGLIDHFIPGWLEWLSWLIWPIFLICFFMVGFYTFTLLANILAAPFYGKLSARTLMLISGKSAGSEIEPPIFESILSELKRQAYLILRAIPILLLLLVPGINIIASFLWMLFGAWSMVLEYMTYPLEREGLLFPAQRGLIKSIRLGTLSFGGLVMIGLTLPLINILIPPAAVIGATVYLQNIKTQSD